MVYQLLYFIYRCLWQCGKWALYIFWFVKLGWRQTLISIIHHGKRLVLKGHDLILDSVFDCLQDCYLLIVVSLIELYPQICLVVAKSQIIFQILNHAAELSSVREVWSWSLWRLLFVIVQAGSVGQSRVGDMLSNITLFTRPVGASWRPSPSSIYLGCNRSIGIHIKVDISIKIDCSIVPTIIHQASSLILSAWSLQRLEHLLPNLLIHLFIHYWWLIALLTLLKNTFLIIMLLYHRFILLFSLLIDIIYIVESLRGELTLIQLHGAVRGIVPFF